MNTRSALLMMMICLPAAMRVAASNEHSVQGMLLQVDRAKGTISVSCDAIPGYMEAMVMPFAVREPEVLKTIERGSMVRFTMVERGNEEYAEHLQAIKIGNYEAEPTEAARLTLLHRRLDPAAASTQIAVGQQIPDFTLTDQAQRATRFAQFRGKVVALTFAYSRCPNPNYCFRLSNNLSRLSRRFQDRTGHDLVLVTIVIDPDNDQGKALERYADTWKADPVTWHFLTGKLADVRSVAELFGMNFWNDEGFLTHSFHTAVIDREGRLAANLEGNQFTAEQLGDLVETVLGRPSRDARATQAKMKSPTASSTYSHP
ncbi:MAG TPA: SCO family protein [Nitrospira sp.]|nr:SCO family protein [Nitrospira sp.]